MSQHQGTASSVVQFKYNEQVPFILLTFPAIISRLLTSQSPSYHLLDESLPGSRSTRAVVESCRNDRLKTEATRMWPINYIRSRARV